MKRLALALSLLAAPAFAQQAQQPKLPPLVEMPSDDVVAVLQYMETRPLGEVKMLYSKVVTDLQKAVEPPTHPPASTPAP